MNCLWTSSAPSAIVAILHMESKQSGEMRYSFAKSA